MHAKRMSCARLFGARREREQRTTQLFVHGMRLDAIAARARDTGRTTAFRVTILPLPYANPPRTGPATGPFPCSSLDAGEEILPHVLPARIT